ncbi:MAG: hypothetical protein IJ983_01770, partial [Kiritimatiellae bacterium]|nr:hypothetical protein [Kiritimatiellia bacterium]
MALKLMLNTLSTAVMARMGRVHGNWMTCLAMSNKKLIDGSCPECKGFGCGKRPSTGNATNKEKFIKWC